MIKDNAAVHCSLFSRTRPRSGTSSERTRGIREWVRRVSQAVTTDVLHRGKYDLIAQTTAILKEANRNRRQEMLEHANADQINAVSEMVLNLLRNRIPVHPITMAKQQRYKTTLREVGKRRNSVKRRRAHLQEQKGSGFWSGLQDCFKACCVR